jgi:hypothetical protein
MSTDIPRPTRVKSWTTAILAVLILVPSLWGFAGKFAQFIATFEREADGTFALTPIVNYSLASVGFMLLFGWAALNGMFRNIEGPKYKLLEDERQLDSTGRTMP